MINIENSFYLISKGKRDLIEQLTCTEQDIPKAIAQALNENENFRDYCYDGAKSFFINDDNSIDVYKIIKHKTIHENEIELENLLYHLHHEEKQIDIYKKKLKSHEQERIELNSKILAIESSMDVPL